MARILVLDPDRERQDFFRFVLTSVGHELVDDPARAELGIVDLGQAAGRGWIGGSTPAPWPVVLVSAHAALVAPFRESVAAVLDDRVTAARLLAAVSTALGAPPSTPRLAATLAEPATPRNEVARLRGHVRDPKLESVPGLVVRGTRSEAALVTLLDEGHQHFLAHAGLPHDLEVANRTPREWSFCQHVVQSGRPLVVEDATRIPALAASPLVELGIVRAYAGVPVRVAGLGVVGTVCALSSSARSFDDHDLATLELAAGIVESRLAARAAVAEERPAPPSSARGPDLVGTILEGRYRITSPLGAGGMSRVFLARDLHLGTVVAVKTLDASTSASFLAEEARVLAERRHPSIVRIHGSGSLPDGRGYLVLDWVQGVTLDRHVEKLEATTGRRLAQAESLRLLRQLSGALETLHAAGIVHGDLKPDNVVVDVRLDRAILIDFGLAMRIADPPKAGRRSTTRIGTPGWSSPEQLSGVGEPAASMDVYALGALAHFLLSARLEGPFAHLPSGERLAAQLRGPGRLGVGSAIEPILRAALSPDPNARPRMASDLLDDLEAALSEAPATQRDPQVWELPGRLMLRSRAVVDELEGPGTDAKILSTLAPELRAQIVSAAESGLIPASCFVHYARTWAGGDRGRVRELGRRARDDRFREHIRSLQIEWSAHALLRSLGPLLRRTAPHVEVAFERVAPRNELLRLRFPREHAPEGCSLIAGIATALVENAAPEVDVFHRACVAQGDDQCVLDVRWE